VIADLDALGLVERIEAAQAHRAARRSQQRHPRPLLTDQWFVDIKPLAAPAIRAVEEGHIRFVPENWSGVYFEWMRNIKDWCISRQLWWGHRIPAWYDDAGAGTSPAAKPKPAPRTASMPSVPLRQDDDVLDTWFSSALWPFSTQGWPDDTPAYRTYYPTSVLVTGFDIIFFWVARMIMMGLKFTGEVPFREVYVHGLIRDHDGQKMSKSKGNVIDPLDIVDGISLDALLAKRTTGLMQPQMKPGHREGHPQAISPRHRRLRHGCPAPVLRLPRHAKPRPALRHGARRGYRNFCNKLWNARATSCADERRESPAPTAPRPGAVSQARRRAAAIQPGRSLDTLALSAMLSRVETGFAEYRLDVVANALYEFTWHEYCDWYLELSKATVLLGGGHRG
jgi:valyl-tRNA synthetase